MKIIKDDYISKLEAVRILQKAYADGRIQAKDGCVSLLDDINAMPVADVQPSPKWISVKDRLPEEEGGDVLVWIVDGKPDGRHHIEAEYIANWEGGNFYDWDWNAINGITHWMPLPEPPKGGDS